MDNFETAQQLGRKREESRKNRLQEIDQIKKNYSFMLPQKKQKGLAMIDDFKLNGNSSSIADIGDSKYK